MRYQGTVIRPPSEANSYILQVTFGCAHNACAFCGTYLDKPFRLRPEDEILADLELARAAIPDTRRVFLADGNALVLSTSRLVAILDELAASFPDLQRVTSYANAKDLLTKSPAELRLLRDKGLRIIYMGLESGSEKILRQIRKGSTAAEMTEAVHRAKSAGIKTSVICLLGLGGPELSGEHAEATGRVVSEMDPNYLSMLTLMLVPGTSLHRRWLDGEFQLMEPEAMLAELRHMIGHLNGLTRCLFRTNHASNYVPLAGTLTRDKQRLLAVLDAALSTGRSAFRPEAWRGL